MQSCLRNARLRMHTKAVGKPGRQPNASILVACLSQAAAERERRLALSSAIARQTLAAGLDPDEARARALYGVSPAAATSAALQAAQYEHVLHVAHQLAQQNELLTRAVQENSAQLAQQQVGTGGLLILYCGRRNGSLSFDASCDAPGCCFYAAVGFVTKASTLLVLRRCCNLRWWVTVRVRTEDRVGWQGTLLLGAPPR